MTAVFEKHEIQFMYPENWKLVENNETDDFVEVSLESPEGCIWSVSVFPSETDADSLIEHCSEALNDQYEDFERFDYQGEIDQIPVIGFDANFYCLDFLVTAAARALKCGDKCLNIYYQAESRDFDKNAQVFNAITLSLVQSIR